MYVSSTKHFSSWVFSVYTEQLSCIFKVSLGWGYLLGKLEDSKSDCCFLFLYILFTLSLVDEILHLPSFTLKEMFCPSEAMSPNLYCCPSTLPSPHTLMHSYLSFSLCFFCVFGRMWDWSISWLCFSLTSRQTFAQGSNFWLNVLHSTRWIILTDQT